MIVDSDSQQMIAIAKSPHQLFEFACISACEIQLGIAGKTFPKSFRLILKIAPQGLFVILHIGPG